MTLELKKIDMESITFNPNDSSATSSAPDNRHVIFKLRKPKL